MDAYYKGNMISFSGGGSSPLEGKSILFIGDSNLQYMGDGLKTYLMENTGCRSVTNVAVAGSTWVSSVGTSDTATSNAVGQINRTMNPYASTGLCTSYDVVCIMMGTNDTDSNAGTLSDTGTNTVAGAMNYCLKRLLWFCRESTICGIIPPQSEYSQTKGARFDIIKEVYDYYSIPTFDFFTSGQVVFNTKVEGGNSSGTGNKASYLGDPVHFGANGKNQFYRKITRFLESLV